MVCPFTKVEESFYIQAAHDFLYTKNISQFDHQHFPGVVPRTAVPIYVLSSFLKPVTFFTSDQFKPTMQVSDSHIYLRPSRFNIWKYILQNSNVDTVTQLNEDAFSDFDTMLNWRSDSK